MCTRFHFAFPFFCLCRYRKDMSKQRNNANKFFPTGKTKRWDVELIQKIKNSLEYCLKQTITIINTFKFINRCIHTLPSSLGYWRNNHRSSSCHTFRIPSTKTNSTIALAVRSSPFGDFILYWYQAWH